MLLHFDGCRYRVYFENGADVGTLDRKQLTLVDKAGRSLEPTVADPTS